MEEEKTPLAEKPSLEAGETVSETESPSGSQRERKRIILACLIIFFVAFGCRLLSFQDNRFEARKVQTAVTDGYKHTGRLLRQGGISSFFSANSPLSDPNHLGHPPGYSILFAITSGIFGEEDAALQITQILADSAAALIVFLIALSLLRFPIAIIAALLVALAPQFTYNSTLLLPDSISALPILLAVYLLVRAIKRPRFILFLASGALIGISCWLRSNAMLLAPFMLVAFPFLFERGRRLRYSAALLGGTLLVVAPLTIRNFIVYDHFIPVSLGAGQTLLEGIADYDTDGSLGIPNTDMGLMKWEAELYNRPDYYGTLFKPDGVRRDRERIARGLSVIRSHPLWFFTVMVRRGASMLRLERVRLISVDPPVTHSLTVNASPAWTLSPEELLARGQVTSKQAEVTFSQAEQMLRIRGDESKYDTQFLSAPIAIESQTDYLLRIPVRIEQGRMIVQITGAGGDAQLASAIIEPEDWKATSEQELRLIEIPFVSANADRVQIRFANGGSQATRAVAQVGQPQLYALGPSSYNWTRIPRFSLRLLQKLFVTALMLPLTIMGLILLIFAGQRRTIIVLLVVPAYFLCIQSALHTEYRYVLAIHYFLFIFAATALYYIGSFLASRLRKIPFLQRLMGRPAA
ncbi:MAG TPA: glycosyltransferase family 39 protein [Pyrinomonadaceae bacterium]